MKYHINSKTTNIIKNYIQDDSYFISKNKFLLKALKIGPFSSPKNFNINFSSLLHKKILFKKAQHEILQTEKGYYYFLNLNSDFSINYDISIDVKYQDIKFYLWLNFWYSTLDILSRYIYKNKLFLHEDKVDNYLFEKIEAELLFGKRNSYVPTFVEMKNLFLDFKTKDEEIKEKFDQKNLSLRPKFIRHLSLDKNTDDSMVDNLLSPKEPKTKIFQDSSDNMIELINNLSKDPNLLNLIDGVNKMASQRKIEHFDENEMVIRLEAKDLDKFKKADKMHPDFQLELHYKIII